jgi:Cu-Zn family superoxide dismutase
MKRSLYIACLVLAVGACGGDDDDGAIDGGPPDAGGASVLVTLLPTVGTATVTGSGIFQEVAGGVIFVLEIANAVPGAHGVHIHALSSCDDAGMAAGDHFNPESMDHGMPGGSPSHLGDLGNMTIAADGTGRLEYTNPDWRIGDGSTGDVVNHAVVFHEVMDDFGQPLGNAGARIGCGVVQAP